MYATYIVLIYVYLFAICRLLFQQSSRFADMEKRYNFLQQEAERFLDMENKVSLISEKVIVNILIGLFLVNIYHCFILLTCSQI